MSLRIYTLAKREAALSYKKRMMVCEYTENAAPYHQSGPSPRQQYALRDVTNRILPPERTNSVLVMRASQDLINAPLSDDLSNNFVLSQAEMGPISAENYHRMQNVPQTMLDSTGKVESQCSSQIGSRGPSQISIVSPMNPPSCEDHAC